MKSIIGKVLAALMLVLLAMPELGAASQRSYWESEGYLVIGTCTTSLLEASREYDLRVGQGFPYVHIRNTRNWATNLQAGYYAIVYFVSRTLDEANQYADEVRRIGIEVYVKHSGRMVGEAGGKRGYHVIGLIASDLEVAQREWAKRSSPEIPDLGVWHSFVYRGVEPGYYFLAYAFFESESDAQDYSNYLRTKGIETQVKYLEWRG